MNNILFRSVFITVLFLNLNSNSLRSKELDLIPKVILVEKTVVPISDLEQPVSFEFDSDLEIKGNRKKKREKAAAIFWGMANAVTSIAQAANVSGKNENPAEGVTNFIANIFNTAAQISQIDANYSKKPELIPLRNKLVFDFLVSIVESLHFALQEDKGRFFGLNSYPLLMELSSIVDKPERVSWISSKILENDFVQNFIKESLDFMEYFLHQKVNYLLNFLRTNLLIKYNSINNIKLIKLN